MNFPLLKGPCAVAFLDDDEHFLESLSFSMPERFNAIFVSSPTALDKALAPLDELLKEERLLLSKTGEHGASFQIKNALDYFSWAGRHQIYSVLVSDQMMPAESGVRVCARHGHFGMRRILLTGASDADLAVKAFNKGSIELFMSKQDKSLPVELRAAIAAQIEKSMEIRSWTLSHSMPEHQLKFLSSPAVVMGLLEYVKEMDLVEYVVVSEPLGIMGLNSKGRTVWIQIENNDSLYAVCQAMDETGWDPQAIELVRQKKMIPNMELATQIDDSRAITASAREISRQDGIYASDVTFEWASVVTREAATES